MTVAYDTFETAIEGWAEAVTGLRFYWRNQKRKWEQSTNWGTLHVTSERHLGIDDVRESDAASPSAGAEIDVLISGQRLITVQVRVKSRNQEALRTARFHLSKLRTSLRKPSVRRTHLQPAQIAVVRAGQTIDLDASRQHRIDAFSGMDVIFGTVVNEADVAETFIETVRVTSDYKDPAGVSLPDELQLIDFDIPQP